MFTLFAKLIYLVRMRIYFFFVETRSLWLHFDNEVYGNKQTPEIFTFPSFPFCTLIGWRGEVQHVKQIVVWRRRSFQWTKCTVSFHWCTNGLFLIMSVESEALQMQPIQEFAHTHAHTLALSTDSSHDTLIQGHFQTERQPYSADSFWL